MDDYRWALRECRRRGIESHVDGDPFDSLAADIGDLASQFQDAAFSLVDASGDRFGRRFERALGSVASAFLRSHIDHATGSDLASFRLRERAAADPSALWRLQLYDECAFLPQPLEREWLRRHDPELELVTHARNARMADYVVHRTDSTPLEQGSTTTSHSPTTPDSSTPVHSGGEPGGGASASGDCGVVHLVVGAAQQPGVRYYLERYRDGDRTVDSFDAVLDRIHGSRTVLAFGRWPSTHSLLPVPGRARGVRSGAHPADAPNDEPAASGRGDLRIYLPAATTGNDREQVPRHFCVPYGDFGRRFRWRSRRTLVAIAFIALVLERTANLYIQASPICFGRHEA
jgi:hypothetical protein